MAAPEHDHLVEACTFLIDRGFTGLVWLDTDLVVRERAGKLVDFVAADRPIGEATAALFGFDDDIRELARNPRHRFELANVKIVGDNADSPRLNFYLHWLETSERYLVIVVRNTAQAELEAELDNQSRRRSLAEAKSIEQAKALAAANAQLTRVNRELDEFTSIISHDLKSPMRNVRYLTEDIEAALERGDREDVGRLLADLKQQARRMSHMLTDLLTYAKISPNSEEALVETDTRALAEAIIASLPRPRGFVVELAGTWPVMRTVAAALDLVVRNLLDNAIKHHDRPDGRVTLTASGARAGLEIEVADDGPGIPPRYHNAIFQPFRKLEQDGRGDGRSNGMGLSLVRKTVETNGATLQLESAPAVRRGTTFRLRWPGEIVA